jgi:hypothetical protein
MERNRIDYQYHAVVGVNRSSIAYMCLPAIAVGTDHAIGI